MRREDRATSREEALNLLERAVYGVLSTASKNGVPYGVPVHFCLVGDCVYFHCAVEGRKIENLSQNKRVSFCVVGEVEVLPDSFSTRYESVIVDGEVEEVFEGEKEAALDPTLTLPRPESRCQGAKMA